MTWRNPHFNYKYKEWFLPWCVKFTSGKKNYVFFPIDNLFHKYHLIRSFYSKMEWKGQYTLWGRRNCDNWIDIWAKLQDIKEYTNPKDPWD